MRGVYALAVVITVVLVLIIAGRLYTSNADYNPGNPYGNGFTKFYAGHDVNTLYHLSDLPSGYAGDTTLLIVSPTYKYGPADSATIKSYLNDGGNLVVIDDFGESDSLLSALNTSIQVRAVPLLQDDNNYNSNSLPIISNLSNTGVTAGISQLFLSRPGSLITGNRSAILAYSGNRSWLDTNGNGILDTDEIYGQFPVIARENYGSGSVTVIADPDIFANDMISMGDNGRLAANIFSGRKVYLDLSHSEGVPTLMTAFSVVKQRLTAQILLIAAILLISFTGFVMVRRFYPGPEVDDGEGDLDIAQEEPVTADFKNQAHPGQSRKQ